MENFTNSVLLPENLPEIESPSFTGLNRKYLIILYIRMLIALLFLSGAFITFIVLSGDNIPIKITFLIAGAIVLVIAFSAVLTILGFPKKGYLVREKDVSFQRGLITYKVTSVPLNRIQHVEVNQGILEKMLKLSSVKIYTAGGTSSDLTIPGLTESDAQKLKAFLSGKISAHE
jgi:membrane protein YdbS with pleckstrin-like domain